MKRKERGMYKISKGIGKGGRSLHADNKQFTAMFSVKRMRKTWNQVRRELRQVQIRDSIDWLDWVYQVEETLKELRRDILEGEYEPAYPTRYELAKSKGAFRYITIPNVRDILVYRHITDEVLNRAIPFAFKGAYFSRRHAKTAVGPKQVSETDMYLNFYKIWLRYNEYRSRTLLSKAYRILVTTDITNYFDSIQHDLLIEYLAPLGLPRKSVALLGRLLEILKPEAGHSPNPRVGLPVDELDCSRQLAHVFLFEHDRRVAKEVRKNNYVRWMDDMNIGVSSETEARKVVNLLTRSLCEQRLTLNAGKTRFLTEEDVIKHFHLEANERLTQWEEKWNRRNIKYREASRELIEIWNDAVVLEGEGLWEKILKRFYAQVIRTKDDFLDKRALGDLIKYPELGERIFESFAKRKKIEESLNIFKKYVNLGESLFEATEFGFFDALLLCSSKNKEEREIRDLIRSYSRRKLGDVSRKPLAQAAALLCYYWFGGSLKNLMKLVDLTSPHRLAKEVTRVTLAIIAAVEPKLFEKAAISFTGHCSDDVAKLVQFIRALFAGAVKKLKYVAHLKSRWPLPGKFYDARAWLTLEIISHAPNEELKQWINGQIATFEKYARTMQEKRVLKRIKLNRKIHRREVKG